MNESLLANTWRRDVPAAVVVVLVAIPLCLGIALASGAPLTAGLIAGVIGGLLVGTLSGSAQMVSGPAAGLVAIVITGIAALGSFSAFLVAVVIAGVVQLIMGLLRVGIVGYFFPNAVIRGMIAAIGVILVLKQLPHALGYDATFVGDEAFLQANAENTFTALRSMLDGIHPGALIIALTSLVVLLSWERSRPGRVFVVPAAMLAVGTSVLLKAILPFVHPSLALDASHLVQLPVVTNLTDWMNYVQWPDWSVLRNVETWKIGVTLAMFASLETLLSLEAADRLDPFKRESDANRELLAQGAGNVLAGLVGGLPVSGVIVRSAANIDAGAQTRRATITHGALLLVAVLALPALLNHIPIAGIAAILLYTGFKLVSPALFRTAWNQGAAQFIPFAVTLVAIVFTDLLIGIGIGLAVALFFILREHLRQPALRQVSAHGAVLKRFVLPEQVTFLNKANIERTLAALPEGSRVEIDGRQTTRFDLDALEQLYEFEETARVRDIDYRLVGIPAAVTTPSHSY